MADHLTDAQARLLELCCRYPGWHLLGCLRSIRLLSPGDADQVDALVERGLLARSHNIDAVQITDAGRAMSEQHGKILISPADETAMLIKSIYPWMKE